MPAQCVRRAMIDPWVRSSIPLFIIPKNVTHSDKMKTLTQRKKYCKLNHNTVHFFHFENYSWVICIKGSIKWGGGGIFKSGINQKVNPKCTIMSVFLSWLLKQKRQFQLLFCGYRCIPYSISLVQSCITNCNTTGCHKLAWLYTVCCNR